MKKTLLSVAVASALVCTLEADTKDDQLVTRTEVGYIQTGGNTDTQTFNAEIKAKKGWGKHVTNFLFDAQYATTDSVEIRNRFVTELTYDYEFDKRFSVNYLLGYRDDKFSGFDYQLYTGPGAKYKAIVSKQQNLSVDGNLLYAKDRYEDVYVDASGTQIKYPNSTAGATLQNAAYDNDYMAYRVKGVYDRQILENLKFTQDVSLRGSFEDLNNFFFFSKTGFTSKLSDILSAGISYKIDYVNEPADGKKSTDNTFTANVIIDY